jgi:hypothetical protein
MKQNPELIESGKAKYETPVLSRVGAFEDITNASLAGANVDLVFPTDTPKSKFTFS